MSRKTYYRTNLFRLVLPDHAPMPNATQVKELERWMAAEPGRRELVEQAVKLLDTTRIPEKELPAGQIAAAESALMERIRRTHHVGEVDQMEKLIEAEMPGSENPSNGGDEVRLSEDAIIG